MLLGLKEIRSCQLCTRNLYNQTAQNPKFDQKLPFIVVQTKYFVTVGGDRSCRVMQTESTTEKYWPITCCEGYASLIYMALHEINVLTYN